MRCSGLQAFVIANLNTAARCRALLIDATRNTGANLAREIHTAHRLLLGATKTHLPRTHLHQHAFIQATLHRLLPVERDAVVRTAGPAALTG